MLPNGQYDEKRPMTSIEIMEFTEEDDNVSEIDQKLASYSFSIDERVAWIDIEGVPLSVWSRNNFAIISLKWGSLLYKEDEDDPYFHRKRLCIKTTTNENIFDSFKIIVKEGKSKDVYSKKVSEVEEIPEIIFEVEEPGEIKFSATKENKSEDLEKVQFDDPFNLYDLLEKKQSVLNAMIQSERELKYPSGFTPRDTSDINSLGADNQVHDTSKKEHGSKAGFKEDANTSVCSGHFKRVGRPFRHQDLLGITTVSNYFIAIMGKWLPNDKNLLITTVYAPQELSEKRMLWQYLVHVIEGWKGDIIVMDDFNEVRTAEERFGSIFNARGAAAFNSFISTGGLVEVPSGGYSYTWAHKSAAKMSKLDRFLISKDLMRIYPNISSIILDTCLSNHRPILLHEISLDYWPTPFCFFHHWFDLDGFDLFVIASWKAINIQEPNAMLKLVKKLKLLKGQIRLWVKDKKDKAQLLKNSLKKKLAAIDSSLDKGDAASDALEDRLNTMNNLTNLERMESLELAQKAKIKWSIEGDENLKKFHGIINKQRNNLAIRGIIVDGEWIEDPMTVNNKFLAHFRDKFDTPCKYRLTLDMNFPNKLSTDQMYDLERPFLKEEIKGAMWDCGLNKSSGPGGFTFGFYRKFWS
ncbi:RNA-directed DNA polymerase, eukaryota [Tanacetum coccineum]